MRSSHLLEPRPLPDRKFSTSPFSHFSSVSQALHVLFLVPNKQSVISSLIYVGTNAFMGLHSYIPCLGSILHPTHPDLKLSHPRLSHRLEAGTSNITAPCPFIVTFCILAPISKSLVTFFFLKLPCRPHSHTFPATSRAIIVASPE